MPRTGSGWPRSRWACRLRLAVIDLDPKGPNSKVLTVINPAILESSVEESTYNEGCLSVPKSGTM